jgi:hypothetical protein
VWLANCYFALDSSGFLPCYDSAMRNLLVLFQNRAPVPRPSALQIFV